MKICIKCGSSDFYLSGDCKPCTRKRQTRYYSANQEKIKKNVSEWKAKNKEKRQIYEAKWRHENLQKSPQKDRALPSNLSRTKIMRIQKTRISFPSKCVVLSSSLFSKLNRLTRR
jgi:hypothetical protein